MSSDVIYSNENASAEPSPSTDDYVSIDAMSSPESGDQVISVKPQQNHDSLRTNIRTLMQRTSSQELAESRKSRLVKESKQRIQSKFDSLERELELSPPSTIIAEGNLSLDDLTDSIDSGAVQGEDELASLLKKLKLRETEIEKLSKFRSKVEVELDDLTASLFDEANRMVREAKYQKSKSEKSLKESNMKNEVLLAEVKALKALVLSSTPNSRVGSTLGTSKSGSLGTTFATQLAPKLMKNSKNGFKAILQKASSAAKTSGSARFKTVTPNVTEIGNKMIRIRNVNGCKKSPSNYELGGDAKEPASPLHCERLVLKEECISISNIGEIDPVLYDEFVEWRNAPSLDLQSSRFMRRVQKEDIEMSFNFKNEVLSRKILDAISKNNIVIELNSEQEANERKKCILLEHVRHCKYRIKIEDDWLDISQLVRNRISAVCDLFCYLRYIHQGLVKSGTTDVYWEIIRRKRNVAMARLGFTCL